MIREPIRYVGYTGFKVENPELVNALRKVSRQTIVFSNNPEMAYFLSGRPAYMRPIYFDQYSLEYREDYDQQIQFARDSLDQGAIYAQLRKPGSEEQEVIDALEISPIASFDEGVIYGASEIR
jgi:hypothetical protein